MGRRFEEDAGRFDGMSDGDERTVETPFGEVVFQFEAGDASVGIPSGVVAVSMTVGHVEFDREALETAIAYIGDAEVTMADALERWAGEQ